MPTTSKRPREKMWIRRNKGRWTSEEHAAFLNGLRLFQRDNWAAVASVVPTRTVLQVRTHAQKYFNKVDKGEEFPEEPYPSQYDTESGKSGTAAGAYLYGVPRDDRQQQQPEPRAAARPSISTEVPLALTPPPLDGGIGRGSVGGGVVSEILCPAGFMISREHPQPAAAAAAVSVVEAAAVSAASAEPAVPRGVDGDYMVPPSAYPSSPHGGGDRGGGGGSGSSDPLLTPFVHGNMSRGVQHSHALPTAAPGSVAFGGLRWVGSSGGASAAGPSASTSAGIMNTAHHGIARRTEDASTNDSDRTGSFNFDGNNHHNSSSQRASSGTSSTNVMMGPASSPSSCSRVPYICPPPSPFWDSISSADASGASSASSFAGDGSFALGCGGSFQHYGSLSQHDSGRDGGGFPRNRNDAHHHESAHPPHLQSSPVFEGPAVGDGASSTDFGKMSSYQQEGQALEDLIPFDGWLDMPLLGDGDHPCGEYDSRKGDDSGMMGGDGGGIGLEDFGVL